jgi:hypothetical protein
MAAIPPAAIGLAMQEVFNALTVCELPPGAIFVLTQVDMFNTVLRFGRLATNKEVTKMCEAVERCQPNYAFPIIIGTIPKINLQVLAWWVRDRECHMMPLEPGVFTQQVLVEATARKHVDDGTPTETTPSAKDLPKFNVDDFETGEEAFKNLMERMKNGDGDPLSYVIRSEDNPVGSFYNRCRAKTIQSTIDWPGV